MKSKRPASGKGQGLDKDFVESNSSTKPTKLSTSRNGHKVLEGIARKLASRGYYPSPSAAMKVLMEGGI